VLGGEAFEHIVRVRGVPDGELSDRPFCSDAVEHHHPTRAAQRDEARERVDQLVPIGVRPGVEEVRAVEEVKRGIHLPDDCKPVGLAFRPDPPSVREVERRVRPEV